MIHLELESQGKVRENDFCKVVGTMCHFTRSCFQSRPSIFAVKIIILHTQLTLYCYGRSPGKGLQGLFIFSEQKFLETNGPGKESSRERTVQGTNVPGNEWSRERKFHHGNECSREPIVLRTNVPDTT